MSNRHDDAPLRIALIGCGAIAERYHLPALAANPRTRAGIVLVDSNRDRLADIARKHDIRDATSDYRELPGKIDGVIIATPPASHREIALHFLARGVHVLCEKPLADTAADAREMIAAATATGVTLSVNQTRRLFPTYGEIRRLISAGDLGTIRSVSYHEGCDFDWPAASPFQFAPGARGVLADVGIHILDAICWWLGGRPTLVSSENDAAGGPEAMATVRLAHDECAIDVVVSRLGRLANQFKIVGSHGVIEAGHEDWDEVVLKTHDGRRRRVRPRCDAKTYADFAHPLIANFVDVIAGRQQPLIPAESVLPALELIDDAYAEATHYPAVWNDRFAAQDSAANIGPVRTPRRVLVTGASGFVGARVVEALALTELATPIAAVRQWARAARPARRGVELALFDLFDESAAVRSLAGVDAVVHCAYAGEPRSIVEGTRTLLTAAEKAGVRRLVYLSSAEVYGSGVSGEVDESAPTPLVGRPYGDAKVEAENLCRSAAARGLDLAILRPSLVYGPGSASWTVNVAKRLLSGSWGCFEGFGDGIANLVYVDDLVRAIVLAISGPNPCGEAFNVNGPDRVTWNEYFQRFNAALGQKPLETIAPTRSRLRTWAMDGVGRVTDVVRGRFEDRIMELYLRGGWASRVMKRIKGALDATPSGAELTDLYARRAFYDDGKARRVLGYEPLVDLDEGLAMSVAWLRQHLLAGAVPPPQALLERFQPQEAFA